MKKRKMVIVLVMMVLCLMLALTGCSTKIDAFQYLSVSYDGYNGNGTAYVDGEDEMIESIVGSDPKDFTELGEWILAYDALDGNIEIACLPDSGLSNGDTVEVTVTVSGDAAEKIKGGTMKFQVSGLPEVEAVDIFKDISMEYEGIIGDTTRAVIRRNSDSEIVQQCQFAIDPVRDLQNGDTVTVTITNPDALAEQYLCVPQELTKTFMVSGLDAYLMDADLLPEDQIREIIDRYIPVSHKEDDFVFSYSDSVYYKTYFCIGDKGTIGADVNRLMIFICYDEYMDGNYHETVYIPLIFRNVIMSSDGAVELDYEDGYTAVLFTDPDEMIVSFEDDYTMEEVYIEY